MGSARSAWTKALDRLETYRVHPKRERMGNRVTCVDGLKFRSKLEADRYSELKLLRAAGEVKWFLRQVPFDVAPGVIYRADFLVVWNLGGTVEKITVEDTKGFLTDTARVKLAVVAQRYGISVQILTRAQVRG